MTIHGPRKALQGLQGKSYRVPLMDGSWTLGANRLPGGQYQRRSIDAMNWLGSIPASALRFLFRSAVLHYIGIKDDTRDSIPREGPQCKIQGREVESGRRAMSTCWRAREGD